MIPVTLYFCFRINFVTERTSSADETSQLIYSNGRLLISLARPKTCMLFLISLEHIALPNPLLAPVTININFLSTV